MWICKNVSRYTRCIPNFFGGRSLRRGDTNKGFNNPSKAGCLGNNIGWLVTWEFPVRTDSASWKSLESFIQFTSFCNSCNLPDNSTIVFWSSMSFCLVESIEGRTQVLVPRCHQVGFLSLIINFRPILSRNSWILSFRRQTVNRSAQFSTESCLPV